MSSYLDIMKAEGHDIQGEMCQKCWDHALSRTKWKGGKVLDHYRDILRESIADAKARVA